MTSMSSAALLIALAMPLVVGAQQDRQTGGIGLTVFSDSDFRGRNATFRNDTPDLAPYDLDDRISSLRVGPGEIWEVCDLPNYQGRCQVFSGTERSLSRSGWSDIISSVRRVRSGGVFPPPIQPPIIGVGLELFASVRFQGDRRVLTNEVPDLRRVGFNDRTSSIRLGQSQAWEVCVETNYRGCRVINTDWPDLSGLGMTRRISSVRPWNQGGGVRPPFPGVDGRIILFDDRNFRGRSVTVDGVRPVLSGFQEKAESVQVTGGLWELCERANFGGRCTIVSSNVSDLGALGLRNRVSSVRPRPSPYPR